LPAARRRSSNRGRPGAPAWLWLLAGILVGLGLAYYLWSKGYIPQPGGDLAVSEEPPGLAAPISDEEVAPAEEQPGKSRYDFFTVLPEMEVVVPEQELNNQALPTEPASLQAEAGNYLLQVGSFQNKGDAEQMKARLALLGITARIQSVTVNDATWHRVRVGPVNGARQADEMRRRLDDNGIDSLVMKNQ